MDISHWTKKAEHSSFYRSLLNFGLNRMIPFNRPHGISVTYIREGFLRVKLPYKKSNFNHIRGIHACGLATLSEFTTGFLLLSSLDASQYRLIMQRLSVDYHYQAKKEVVAEFSASREWLEEMIKNPLKTQEKILVDCEVRTHDLDGNHICTAVISWQIKRWDKVRTSV